MDMLDWMNPGKGDIGSNNSANGNVTEILLVPSSVLGTNEAGLIIFETSGNVIVLQTILINENVANYDGHTAHEIGHGYVANVNENVTLQGGNTYSTSTQFSEHAATKEFFAEIIAVLENNFHDSTSSVRWETTKNWVSPAGHDYSQEFTHDDMIEGDANKYFNARVGGYAFYKIASDSSIAIGQVAKILMRAIDDMVDVNQSKLSSFAEVRVAMIAAAGALGYSNSIKALISDSWAEAGVGVSGQGGSNPVSTPPLHNPLDYCFSNCIYYQDDDKNW